MRFTKESGYALVEEYQGSGLKQKEFCAQRGVKQATLCYWIASVRRNAETTEGEFQEVKPDKHETWGFVEIICGGGVIVRINERVAVEYVADLVRAL